MTDRGRTRESLIEELQELRQLVTELRAREQPQPQAEAGAPIQIGNIVSIGQLREAKRKAEAASKA